MKDFSQKRRIDFKEIFSYAVKVFAIRVIFGFAASIDLEIKQLDMKIVSYMVNLEEKIYMVQPKGF